MIDRDDKFYYDGATSVLTSKGFRNISTIKEGDKVYSLSPNKVWVLDSVEKSEVVDYEGNLIYCSSNVFDLVTTPNHHHVCKRVVSIKDDIEISPIDFILKYPKNVMITKVLKNAWKPNIVSDKTIKVDERHVNLLHYVKLLLFSKRFGKIYTTGDSMVNKKYILEIPSNSTKRLSNIESVLKSIFGNYIKVNKVFRVELDNKSKISSDLTSSCIKGRGIPFFIKNLPIDMLEEVIKIYDNFSTYNYRRDQTITYINEKEKSDLMEILVKIGVSFRLQEKSNRINVQHKFSTAHVKTLSIESFPYKGEVYNLKLKNNKIISVLRNKDVTLSSSL